MTSSYEIKLETSTCSPSLKLHPTISSWIGWVGDARDVRTGNGQNSHYLNDFLEAGAIKMGWVVG